MALENLISINFTEAELSTFNRHLEGIQELLTGKTVNLTPEDRQQYGRIANQNKLIVDKAKNYMEEHPQWVPAFLDKAEFDRDYKARKQVETLAQHLEGLAQQLIDTKTLLDHDNYTNALSFYRNLRFLAGENEPGSKTVYQDMKLLFTKTIDKTDTNTDLAT